MDEENIWYLVDEVGSAMNHSDLPNFAVHPFIYSPNNKLDAQTITYSVRNYIWIILILDMLAFGEYRG
jgi:tubulin--tyrosine ligase-like protein 12